MDGMHFDYCAVLTSAQGLELGPKEVANRIVARHGAVVRRGLLDDRRVEFAAGVPTLAKEQFTLHGRPE